MWKPPNKAQIKHTKNFSIKNFGAPKTPPLEILYVWAFSCVLKGKEAPNIKNLQGSWALLGGGLGGGTLVFRSFENGVGGQRGLARGNPSCARDSGLFSAPFFLCPLRRRGTRFWRTFLALFGGLLVANPLPPTPFRNLRCFPDPPRPPHGFQHSTIYGCMSLPCERFFLSLVLPFAQGIPWSTKLLRK